MSVQKYPYQITQKIGMYGWNHQKLISCDVKSKVYLGCNLQIPDQLVIIKEFQLNLLNAPDVFNKIKNEITILQQIKSKYLVRVLDLLCTAHRTCIILEYCPDGNLMNYMMNQKILPELQARQVLTDILNGVKELVKLNVFHRNLKPENILLSRLADNKIIFKITDFSFSKLVKNLQDSKDIMTSSKDFDISFFSSPQILKHESYSAKSFFFLNSDIWSIGMIYYFMLFGTLPWMANSKEEYAINICTQELKFPQNIPISDESINFLSKALKVNEEKRIDWNELFVHKIFDLPAQQTQQTPSIVQLNLTKESEKFITHLQNEIQKAKLDAKKLFRQLDTDKSKSLSFQEFSKLLLMIDKNIDQLLADKVFQQFDANKDGIISYTEFKRLILKTNYEPQKIQDNKGLIDSQIKKITESIIGMVLSVQQSPKEIFSVYAISLKDQMTRGEFFEFLKDFDDKIPLAIAECVFKEFATDKAEAIDLNEMIKYFEQLKEKMSPQTKEVKQQQQIQEIPGMSEEIKNLIQNLKAIIKIQELEINQIFAMIDTNQSGTLTFNEVLQFVKVINAKIKEQSVKELFQLMDTNKNGIVELSEFKVLFNEQGK